MLRPLTTLLIALFGATAGSGPLCEIDCHRGHDVLSRTGSAFRPLHEHCQGTLPPAENDQGSPLKEHPCGGGSHQATWLNASALVKSALMIGFASVLPGGCGFLRAVPEAAPAGGSAAPELAALLFARTAPPPLPI